jgi:hypothetical protein
VPCSGMSLRMDRSMEHESINHSDDTKIMVYRTPTSCIRFWDERHCVCLEPVKRRGKPYFDS